MQKLLILSCIALVLISAYQLKTKQRDFSDPYLEILDDIRWYFKDGHAEFQHYADLIPDEYSLKVEGQGDDTTALILRGDQIIYSFPAHKHTTFVIQDVILYYTNYSPEASGCEIIAYNLQERKMKWRQTLVALGAHSNATRNNRVSLIPWNKQIIIFGNEDNKRYLEALDLQTGQTLHNRQIEEKQLNQ